VAEDWLKVRRKLSRHPKVLQMAAQLATTRFAIVGGLVDAWGLFDDYSVDGSLPGYTVPALGEAIGWPGFGEAMQVVEWLEVMADGAILMPRFDTHNGQGAKVRAEDAERKRVQRLSGNSPDKSGTKTGLEKDKRKKKVKNTGVCEHFDAFWNLFPARTGTSKSNKKGCREKWTARGLDAIAPTILADIQLRIEKDSQWLRGFPPNPETYLNQNRWEDGFSATLPKSSTTTAAPPTPAQAAKYRIEQAAIWAKAMRDAGMVPEEEIAEQLARIEAKYGPIARGEKPHA
jgi:hypothetical protein